VALVMIFFVTSLVNGCSLGDAVIVAAPDDVRAIWEVENALDSFPKPGQ
jgi:hypothetical protein